MEEQARDSSKSGTLSELCKSIALFAEQGEALIFQSARCTTSKIACFGHVVARVSEDAAISEFSQLTHVTCIIK